MTSATKKRQRDGAGRTNHDAEPAADDTATLSLTPEDRDRLDMDSWEPSLLRELLSAQNRLKRRRG